jgi:cytidylate kinase
MTPIMAAKYYQIVNKALNYFNLKKRLEGAVSFPEDASYINPFITVAREPGSGGAPIAKAVADKLGFEYVDDQIVQEIARSTKKRKAIIKEIDEKSRSQIDDLIHSLLNVEYIGDEEYITELVRTIIAYAHKGHCVILGRGANFITPFGKGLHVNITAPYFIRVRRAMDYEGLSEPQAKEVIAKVEKERQDFVQQYFNSNIKQRNVFDLSINTSYLSVHQASNVIIEAFKQKFS